VQEIGKDCARAISITIYLAGQFNIEHLF
jgi:hypothetical protein